MIAMFAPGAAAMPASGADPCVWTSCLPGSQHLPFAFVPNAGQSPARGAIAAAGAQGVVKSWDGGALTMNWNDAANWLPDGVPQPTDTVNLGANSALTIRLAGAEATVFAVGSSGGKLLIDGTRLAITNPSQSQGVTAPITVIHDGVLDVRGHAGLQELVLGEAGTPGSVGSLEVEGSVVSGGFGEAAPGRGLVKVDLGGSLYVDGGLLTARIENHGTIEGSSATLRPSAGSPPSDGTFSFTNLLLLQPPSGTTFTLAGGEMDAAVLALNSFDQPAAGVVVEPGVDFHPTKLSIGGATFDLRADSTIGELDLIGGRRRGAGDLAVAACGAVDACNLRSGRFSDAGRTTFSGPVTLSPGTGVDGLMVDGGATVRTTGTTTWGSGELGLGGGSGFWENAGTLTLDGASARLADLGGGILRNLGGGTIAKTTGGPFAGGGQITNAGTIDIARGTFGDTADGTPGTLVQTGGTTSIAAEATLDKAVTVTGGTVAGAGTITALTVDGDGAVVPGGSAIGTLSVAGDYTQLGGTLQVQVAGTSSFDALSVGGSATLGGALAIDSAGFTPAPADTFKILTATGRAATFRDTTGAVVGVREYRPRYDSDGVTLEVGDAATQPPPPPTGGGGIPPVINSDGGGGGIPPVINSDGGGGRGSALRARFTSPTRAGALVPTVLDAGASTGASRYVWDLNGDGRGDIACGADQPRVTVRLASATTRAGALTVRLTAIGARGSSATASNVIQVVSSSSAARAARTVAQPLTCGSNRTGAIVRRACTPSTVEFDVVSARACFRRVTDAAQVPPGERPILDAAVAYFNANERFRTYIRKSCQEAQSLIALGLGGPGGRACDVFTHQITLKEVDPLLQATDLLISYGTVTVDGVRFEPQLGATIAVFPQIGRIISSGAIVKFGDATVPTALSPDDHRVNLDVEGSGPISGNLFSNGRFTISTFTPDHAITDFAGFGIDGQVQLDLVRAGLSRYSEASFRLALPDAFGVFGGKPPSGAVVLRADNDHEVSLDDVDVRVPEAELAGLKFTDVRFHYTAGGGDGCPAKYWKATANVFLGLEDGSAGFRLAPDPPQNGIAFCQGSFKSAGGEFTFGNPIPPPQLFPGVFLKAINFGTQLDPTLIRGGAKITASGITDVDGAVLGVFATSEHPYVLTRSDAVGGLEPLAALAGRRLQSTTFAVGGRFGFSLPVIGRVDFGNGYWLYSYKDYIALGGSVTIPAPGLRLTAGLDGELGLGSGQYSFHGSARACVAGGISSLGCIGGEAWVTSKGIVACGDIAGVLHPGVGYRWGAAFPEIWLIDGCKPSGYWLDAPIAAGARVAAGTGSRTFMVKPGETAVRVRVLGKGGAPDVTLTAPDGEALSTTADQFTHTAHLAALRQAQTGVTWLGVGHGKPGTYTITPRPGSPAISRISTSQPARPAHITASVSGRGARRALRYRIGSTQPGQRVTFFERGSGTYRKLATVAGDRGRLPFTPDAAGATARRITALIEAGGYRLAEPTLARYRVAAPRPRRPGPLRVVRRGRVVNVTWGRVSGAVRYGVVVSPTSGAQRLLKVPARRRSIRLTGATTAGGGTLRVSALDAQGRSGPVRTGRWRATAPPPNRFQPYGNLRAHSKRPGST